MLIFLFWCVLSATWAAAADGGVRPQRGPPVHPGFPAGRERPVHASPQPHRHQPDLRQQWVAELCLCSCWCPCHDENTIEATHNGKPHVVMLSTSEHSCWWCNIHYANIDVIFSFLTPPNPKRPTTLTGEQTFHKRLCCTHSSYSVYPQQRRLLQDVRTCVSRLKCCTSELV